MSELNLQVAETIITAALKEARQRSFKPLTVAVLDAGGYVIALKREDGASFLRPEIATGKARGALSLGFGGRELARRAAAMPAFINAVTELMDGHMVPVAGGVLIRDAGGKLVGAIGITGDTSDNDETAAVAGITAAGLGADTGDPAK